VGVEVAVHIENILKITLGLAAGVLALDLILVMFILRRRFGRRLYYNKKDEATRQFEGPVQGFVAGDITVERLLSLLKTKHGQASRDAIRDLLLRQLAGNRKAVTDVLFRLGYVDIWTKEAFGSRRARQLNRHLVRGSDLPPSGKRRFAAIRRLRLFCVKRARAVAQLGQLDGKFAQVFMQEAIHDHSPYVGRANVAAMGHNREAYEISVLLGLLRQAVDGTSELNVASVKTALVRYPIAELQEFVPFLTDETPRFRFVLVDSIREICESAKITLTAADFPESLRQWFLEKAATDESVDVRARSARVIRHFHDGSAVIVLRALMLDDDEFVRMHTVRACADAYYAELMSEIARRLMDPKWRVREAAVKTLAAFGKPGRHQLAKFFLATSDRYASEQIADEMQRSGIIVEMLPGLGSQNGEFSLVNDVCAKMVRIGKTSLLTDVLNRETRMNRWDGGSQDVMVKAQYDPLKARGQLLDILLTSPTPQLEETVRALARRKEDHLSGKAQLILKSGKTQPAAVGVAAEATGGTVHA
jgi:hypothetical protein